MADIIFLKHHSLLVYQAYSNLMLFSEKNISLSTPLNTRHFHFPFLQSAYLYTRAEGSPSKAQTRSKTPHLTKVNVSRVSHPVGKCDHFWENKSLTKFNIRVWPAGLRTLTSCIRPLCRSLPRSDQGFLTVVLRKAEYLFVTFTVFLPGRENF